MKKKQRDKTNARNSKDVCGHLSVKAQGSNFILWTLFLYIFLATSCNQHTSEEHDTYTCPMHPTVISDRPGSCPVCGMDLVRKARPGEEVEITDELAKLIKSPNERVVASIKTIKAEYKKMPVTIGAQGMVTYDTRNVFTIPSRVAGRLEKIYVKYPFQKIAKGQKVAEIYSPELLTAQREFIFLLENDNANENLMQNSKDKLSFLGLSNSQIEALIKTKQPLSTFSIYSNFSGYLIPDDQKVPEAPLPSSTLRSDPSGMSAGMGGNSSNATNKSEKNSAAAPGTIIREGSYVSAGQVLFKVVDFSSLRVELKIPSSQSGYLKKGNPVRLDFGNGLSRQSSIDFVQPFFSNGEEFSTVRLNIAQTEDLHIGHLVTSTINLDSIEGLWIPMGAVLDLGMEKVVFTKDRNVLKPKKVTTGIRSGEYIEIKSGIASSDEIAANAQYLVDSESFIKTAN